ncbi:hypothetical protein MPRF_04740 [Mycolicibacterium parafortuitum]|uniref:Uncharacterized protein n=1 Tax=Mycolicibacterium parafortuitum TaxID=39692 RepID=A0A7I7TYD4_MYCPF|nr:hypothetical protein [Mycolicibacterium parafortuitum]BBY73575.1 hypothetical protein MPRF_04740 [Mycolicibacterium parafortuitum]
MVNSAGWEFWKLDSVGGGLAWLGLTRPEAKVAVDRRKVWTLIPARRLFVANWFVTEDHHRDGDKPGVWVHENIDIEDARELALEVPDVSEVDMKRLRHPERCLTLDQLDNYSVSKILGSRVAAALGSRR